jgi:hypothetical protein
MQTVVGAVDRDLEPDDAARAEEDLRPAALVHRAVAEDPGIGCQLLRVPREQRREVRRARLLFAFEDEAQVDARRTARGAQGFDRGEQAEDRRLVVAGAARVEPRLRIERAGRLAPGERLAVGAFRAPAPTAARSTAWRPPAGRRSARRTSPSASTSAPATHRRRAAARPRRAGAAARGAGAPSSRRSPRHCARSRECRRRHWAARGGSRTGSSSSRSCATRQARTRSSSADRPAARRASGGGRRQRSERGEHRRKRNLRQPAPTHGHRTPSEKTAGSIDGDTLKCPIPALQPVPDFRLTGRSGARLRRPASRPAG